MPEPDLNRSDPSGLSNPDSPAVHVAPLPPGRPAVQGVGSRGIPRLVDVMASRLEWFPLYVNDWLLDDAILQMTLEQQGAYIRLLCLAWHNDGIPADDAAVVALLGGSGAAWAPPVRGRFVPHPRRPDKLTNVRLEQVRQEQLDKIEQHRESGKMGRAKQLDMSGHRPGGARVPPGDCPGSREEKSRVEKSKKNRTSDSNKSDEIDRDFETLWAARPKRPGESKAAARRAYRTRRKEGVTPEVIQTGLERYARYVKREGTEPRYVKHLATFLGPDRHWEADWGPVDRPKAPAAPYHEKYRTTPTGLGQPADDRVAALVRKVGTSL